MMAINEQEQERFSRSERFFSSTLLRYAGRVLILLAFSLIFQSFDNTFMKAAGSSVLRIFIFSLFYVLYGLLVWEGAVLLASTIEKRSFIKKLPTG